MKRGFCDFALRTAVPLRCSRHPAERTKRGPGHGSVVPAGVLTAAPGHGFWEPWGESTPTHFFSPRKKKKKIPFSRSVLPGCESLQLKPASVCFPYFWQRAAEFLRLHPPPAQAGGFSRSLGCSVGPGCPQPQPFHGPSQPFSQVFSIVSCCSHYLYFFTDNRKYQSLSP